MEILILKAEKLIAKLFYGFAKFGKKLPVSSDRKCLNSSEFKSGYLRIMDKIPVIVSVRYLEVLLYFINHFNKNLKTEILL